MRRRSIRRAKVLAALISGLLLAASFAPTAQAQQGAVSEGDTPAGFVYWEDGFLVATYVANFCAGEGEPMVPGQIIEPGNGTRMWHTRATVPVSVYEIPDIPPERLDLAFGFLAANCDTEPYAQGMARLRSHFRFDSSGVLHTSNSLNGSLRGADGDRVHIVTAARVKIDAATGGLISLDMLRASVR